MIQILSNSTRVHKIFGEVVSEALTDLGIPFVFETSVFEITNKPGRLTLNKLFNVPMFWKSMNNLRKGYKTIFLLSPAMFAIPALVVSRLINQKVYYVLHEPILEQRNFYSLITNKVNKIFVYLSTHIIVLSEKSFKDTLKLNFKGQIIKTHWPSGSNRNLDKNLSKRAYISFIGNLSENKNFELFLETVEKLDEKIFIGGSGDFSKYHKRINQIKDCTFLNRFLTDEEFNHFLSQSKFVLLPYKSSTQSAVLFDSFKNGTPLITSDKGSFREFIDNGENGYVLKLKNFKEEAIEIIKSSNQKEIRRMSNNNYQKFTLNFSSELCRSDLKKVLCEK